MKVLKVFSVVIIPVAATIYVVTSVVAFSVALVNKLKDRKAAKAVPSK